MVSTPLRISESSPIASPDPCFLGPVPSRTWVGHPAEVRALTMVMAEWEEPTRSTTHLCSPQWTKKSRPDSTEYIGNGQSCPLSSVRSPDQSFVDCKSFAGGAASSDDQTNENTAEYYLSHLNTQFLWTLDNRIPQLKIKKHRAKHSSPRAPSLQ